MPKAKAFRFLEKFAAAEGILKYVFSLVAVALLATAFLFPEFVGVVMAVAYGVQATVARYEEHAAREELKEPE